MSDKSILITGALGSIGSYLVRYYKKQGWHVFALDISQNTDIESDKNVSYFCCDLTDADQVKLVFNELGYLCNDIPVLINNAGMIHSEPMFNYASQPTPSHDLSSFKNVINSNLLTTFNVSNAFIEKKISNRQSGIIINMSSISAQGNAGQSAYASAKSGIEAFTKSIAKELGPLGIRAAAISPGFFNTESTIKAMPPAQLNKLKQETPLRKLGELESIAQTIDFIIENDFITGTTIAVDGGLSI